MAKQQPQPAASLASNTQASVWERPRVWMWSLVAIVITVFAFSLHNEFISLDDNVLILENPAVINAEWGFAWKASFGSFDYKPLTYTLWMIEYKLFGPNAAAFRSLNILLFVLNVLLAFNILKTLLARFYEPKLTTQIAFFTTLIWALHPLRVESVTWVVETKDVLYGVFFLGAIWSFLRYLDTKQFKWIAITLVLYIGVLLSKVMGITLPAALCLIAWLYQDEFRRKFEAMATYFWIALGVVIIALVCLPATQAYLADLKEPGLPQSASFSALPAALQALLLPCVKIGFLLWKVIAPIGLSIMYPKVDILNTLSVGIYIIPLALGAAFFGAWRKREQLPIAIFGLCWFVVCISPALIIKSGYCNFAADRYTYIGSIGVILFAVTWILTKLKSYTTTSLAVWAVVLAGLTINYINQWKNSLAVWENTLSHFDDSGFAYNQRGTAKQLEAEKLFAARNNGPAQALFNEAVKDYEAAIKYAPEYADAWANMGNVWQIKGNLDNAIMSYSAALKLAPNNIKVLENRGAIKGMKNDYEGALADFNAAIAIDKFAPKAYFNKAILYSKTQRPNEAVVEWGHYLDFYPDDINVLFYRGVAYKDAQRYPEALSDLNRAISLKPSDKSFYAQRAIVLRALGRNDEAMADEAKAK